MSIALQPGGETMLVTGVTQSAHIIVSHAVGYQSAQIPEEAFALVLRTDDSPIKCGDIGNGVIAISVAEGFHHVISPVQSACLITVFHHYLECRTVLGRNASEQFAQESIKVTGHMGSAQLVHLISRSFLAGGTIGHTRGNHSCANDGPLSFGCFPGECAVLLHAGSKVDYFGGLGYGHLGRLLLCGPHIFSPHGQRGLIHLGQGLLGVSLHLWLVGDTCLELAVPGSSCGHESEVLCLHIGQSDADGCPWDEAYVGSTICAIEVYCFHILIPITLLRLYLHVHQQVPVGGEGDVAQGLDCIKVYVGNQVFACLFLNDDGSVRLGDLLGKGQYLHIGGL